MEKEKLVSIIKEWIKNDNEIREIQKIQNDKKKEKQKITENLIQIMKQHDVDVFDINDGKLQYCKKNIKKPISKKMLLQLLSDYFKEDTNKAFEVNDFILNNRQETEKEMIIRKINNKNIS